MSSFDIHLAIAKKYLTKHKNIENELDFIKGNIAPDMVEDKKISHYTGPRDKNDIIEYLKNKVRIDIYLKENEINTDYDKGVYLHLLTDYLFFNEFIDREYLMETNYDNYIKDLYYSYIVTNEYLRIKYGVTYEPFKEEIEECVKRSQKMANYNKEERRNIISFKKLDEFIEAVSSIEL